MNQNEVVNSNETKSIFTVRKVLRVLATLCIIFVFCPSFLVSCSGESMNVNVMTAVGGVSIYGEEMVEPHVIMLVCLLIPIAILALLFLKKYSDRKTAGIVLGCTAVNLVIWFIFRATVKKLAEENYLSFETTIWYVINIIVMLLIILLTIPVAIQKIQMDSDIIVFLKGGGIKETLDQISNTVTQLAGNATSNASNHKSQKEDTIGFCTKCGSPIVYGCKFCASCGIRVPESMLAETEEAKKATEEVELREKDKQ